MIGVFDSGLGGLSVLRELLQRAPGFDIHYHADQARIPWGPRPASELREYCMRITQALITEGCTHIVVACNTASAVALQSLRQEVPAQTFVGMEPAIKPAAALTRSGVIGLMATQATLSGELLANTSARHAAHLRIASDPCVGLVEAIEDGDSGVIRNTLQGIVPPLVEAGADVLVLGCTHYAFVIEEIREIAGADVQVVDAAPAVVSQLIRLAGCKPEQQSAGVCQLSTSGDVPRFSHRASKLLQCEIQAQSRNWAGAVAHSSTT